MAEKEKLAAGAHPGRDARRSHGDETMILFGTRGITYSKAKGSFHCPQCPGESRSFDHKRVRRFFTLYFVPLIPLDLVGEYVECQRCRGTFDPAVLGYDPEDDARAFQAEYMRAVRRVMIQMSLADGHADHSELEAIREYYGRLTGQDLSRADIDAEVNEIRRDARGISEALLPLAPNLNDSGKELVLRAAIMVASADGHFDEHEWTAIAAIGGALGMSSAHVNGVVSSVLEPRSRAV
jgi:tellurite resistance protein